MNGSSRIRRRILATAGAVAGITLLATGCGVGSSPSAGPSTDPDAPVTLTFQWWGNDDRAAATQKVVDLYEEKHPNVTIETSFAPDANYWEKMATQVAGGNTPDVFQMKLEYFKEYQQRGVIADLTPFTKGDDAVLHTDDTAEAALAAGTLDDKIYGMPTGRSTQSFFYDPAAWAAAGLDAPELGWTWDDFADAGEEIKESSGGAKYLSADFGDQAPWFQAWLLQRGKSLYTDDGEVNFTQKDLEEFWNFTTGLVADGVLTPAEITTANDRTTANSPLVKGVALGEFNDVSLASAYFQAFGEVALAPFPADEDAEAAGMFEGVTQLLTVAKTSTHQEEAAKFIDFFLNDPEAGEILGITRGMPANSAILDDLSSGFTGGDLATYEFETDMADAVVPAPPVAPEGGSESLTEFKSMYDKVIFGQVTVKDAAAQMFAAFQSNIS
ncbi:extracellular solute-binding protein [Microbacterium yannicii]|uniref:Extracellular solute-binding protein n=1 Tax=Microbacterium yannicii TaxID=671622 RepID=A0ABP9LXM8_9MICO|nr:extracellular solute-binding protein [Microbacterium yannicii]MCO5953635.1 extracellular solute-binding protein [Microbacterium yannicii]